ncbi:iron/zinc purple acid phosphatase-like protein [Biomphalaria glabrata]|nr:iron/zinc purple acid phosphatase-like protein [Biomphalaria glabrata]
MFGGVKSCFILLCLYLSFKRSQTTSNFFKDVSRDAVQPLAEDRDLEDESLWCSAEHIHLAYGMSAINITVIWATRGDCPMMVEYARVPWGLDKQAKENMVEMGFAENNSLKYIHRAELQDLMPSTTYYFRVVSLHEVGHHIYYFKTPGLVDETLNFLVTNKLEDKLIAKSIRRETMTGFYSALIYNGDVEPKLNLNYDEAEDSFMEQLENIGTYLPVLTISGKKVDQREDGWYMYRHMFSMPDTDWPMPAGKLWYSLDIGPIHLISYSTDVLFDVDNRNAKLQQDWLVKDLTSVNKRRDKTPWVIAFSSHPMYCSLSVKDTQDCLLNTSKVRQGFEDIFYHFAVDLIIESKHVSYERTWPQYKGVVVGTSYQQPKAPIEVILGSVSDFPKDASDIDVNTTVATPTPAAWSAFHLKESAANSFGNLSVINDSHLEWKLMSADGQTVLDQFWLVQDNHGNFSLASLPHNVSHQINQTIIALGGKPGTYDFISGSTGDPTEGEGLSKYSLWLGLAVLAAVFVLVLGLVAIRSCVRKKRARAGRRWREVDGQSGEGAFYSVASDSDTEDNDFEIDVYDKTNKQSSKLLTSY